MNQCDGCRRKLPLVHGIHYGEGYDMIGCTADRYVVERPLTKEQLVAGLQEARRIVNQSAGYYFGGELIPFAKEFKSLALRAITQLEK